jgi:hypothetical protein
MKTDALPLQQHHLLSEHARRVPDAPFSHLNFLDTILLPRGRVAFPNEIPKNPWPSSQALLFLFIGLVLFLFSLPSSVFCIADFASAVQVTHKISCVSCL